MLQDILDIVHFMRDNMVTKKELKEELRDFATKKDLERFATKQEVETLKSDLITHIDGFVVLHKTLDLEFVSLRAKYQRLESYIFQLANHAHVTLE